MKKILVPTDFTRASESALKVACHIAKKRTDIGIRLSHVYHVPRVPSLPSEDYGYDVRKQKELIVDIKSRLAKLAKKDYVQGLHIETQTIPHKDVKDLIRHKNNKDADLIICGIHGNIDWKQSIEGTHTEIIIRNARCPVMTVNADLAIPVKFDNIVFASDFKAEIHQEFPKLKKLFDLLGGRVHLVKVITHSHFEHTLEVEKMMRAFADKFFLTNYTVKAINEDNVEKGIHMYAYYLHADMIAMETHSHNAFVHYLKGSITESVAHHSELSVLTTRIPE